MIETSFVHCLNGFYFFSNKLQKFARCLTHLSGLFAVFAPTPKPHCGLFAYEYMSSTYSGEYPRLSDFSRPVFVFQLEDLALGVKISFGTKRSVVRDSYIDFLTNVEQGKLYS